ncbi:hypothetical protein BS78_K182600 [Paspalum vaginatum]|uniref:CCHC-type domain-containing protein n=1 Tax=Paspalum vaginatum TaxID=158149 RepID=A0A9W8CDS3_9POAL|nr:hypothetical protein BS78_K182600 [Paspalum vaginatum]
MSKKRGERPKCFECGEVGHFIAECPNKQNDYYKKGKSHSRDSNKYHSGKHDYGKRDHTKHHSGKIKNFQKAFKSYQKDNRKRDKAFFAELDCLYGGSYCSSSSSSTSSDEEMVTKRNKRRDQGGPAGLCFVSTKSKHKHKMHQRSFCSMALEDKDDKGNDKDSSDEEVTPEHAKILEMFEANSRELKAQDRLLEMAAKKLQKQKAKLADALAEIERLKSVPAQSSESECPTCETLMRDLCEQKSKYSHQVEEMDRLKVDCGKLQSKLDEPILSDVPVCEMCPHLALDIAELKVRCEGQLKNFNSRMSTKNSWMARHWFSSCTNPSAGPFAHFSLSLILLDRGLEDIWIMDSGCSRHMTGHRRWFSSLNPVCTKEYITFGDNDQGKVLGVGSVALFDKLSLREVALVRNSGSNLVSVSQLLKEGFEVHFKEGSSCVLDAKENHVCRILPYG